MIAYEELVTALAQWRTRRGLPLLESEYLDAPGGASATVAAAVPARTAPAPAARTAPAAAPRPAAPAATPAVAARPAAVPAAAAANWSAREGTAELDGNDLSDVDVLEEAEDVDPMVDGQDDFAMAFDRAESGFEAEATSIGGAGYGDQQVDLDNESPFDGFDDDGPAPLAPIPADEDGIVEEADVADSGPWPR
jgi:hypothetical protein